MFLSVARKHISIITNTNVLGKNVKQISTDYNYCKLSAKFQKLLLCMQGQS